MCYGGHSCLVLFPSLLHWVCGGTPAGVSQMALKLGKGGYCLCACLASPLRWRGDTSEASGSHHRPPYWNRNNGHIWCITELFGQSDCGHWLVAGHDDGSATFGSIWFGQIAKIKAQLYSLTTNNLPLLRCLCDSLSDSTSFALQNLNLWDIFFIAAW